MRSLILSLPLLLISPPEITTKTVKPSPLFSNNNINNNFCKLRHKLTNNKKSRNLVWSPNGEKIAFNLGGNIYVMNKNGSKITQLTNLKNINFKTSNDFSGIWAGKPVWSPNGEKIAFRVINNYGYRGCCNTDIYIINADGSQLTNLTNDIPGNGYSSNFSPGNPPVWSPDSKQIAFDFYGYIHVVNINNPEKLDFSHETGIGIFSSQSPRWSPDGKQIAFAAKDIYIMNTDGSNLKQLTTNMNTDRPVWSPDGKQIAFETKDYDRLYTGDIYIINNDGSGLLNVSNRPGEDIGAIWSPDGKNIIFYTKFGGGYLYINNTNRSGEINLGEIVNYSTDLALSPDGKYLAFSDDNDIYVIDIEQYKNQ